MDGTLQKLLTSGRKLSRLDRISIKRNWLDILDFYYLAIYTILNVNKTIF